MLAKANREDDGCGVLLWPGIAVSPKTLAGAGVARRAERKAVAFVAGEAVEPQKRRPAHAKRDAAVTRHGLQLLALFKLLLAALSVQLLAFKVVLLLALVYDGPQRLLHGGGVCVVRAAAWLAYK